MKKIISIDGGKGGTGKSVVCSAMIDTALTCKKSVLLVEADTSNPDVAKTYSSEVETTAICLDTREGFLELATAVQKTEAEVVIINNPARSEKWLTFGDVFVTNLPRMSADMRVLWVANRQLDSVELCANFFEKFSALPLVFCMNSYFGEAQKFETWIRSNLRKKVFEAGGGEILFPDAADRVMHAMRNARLAWGDIEKLDFGDLIEAERVRNEFTQMFTPFLA